MSLKFKPLMSNRIKMADVYYLCFFIQEIDATAQLIFEYMMSSQNPFSSYQEFLQTLNGDAQNKILATIMSIDPEKISIGSLNWEKVILDLIDELTRHVNFEEFSDLLVENKIIYSLEQEWVFTEFPDNSSRMAQVICLLSQRYFT